MQKKLWWGNEIAVGFVELAKDWGIITVWYVQLATNLQIIAAGYVEFASNLQKIIFFYSQCKRLGNRMIEMREKIEKRQQSALLSLKQ